MSKRPDGNHIFLGWLSSQINSHSPLQFNIAYAESSTFYTVTYYTFLQLSIFFMISLLCHKS